MPNTWYVDSGSGTDTGHAAGGNTWASAFKTVKYAVETIATGAANARASIIISASVKYHEWNISQANDNLQIRAKAGERVIFDGSKKTSGLTSLFAGGGNSYSGTFYENFTVVNYNQGASYLFKTTGDNVRGAMMSLSGVYAYDNVMGCVKTISGSNGSTSSVGSYDDASKWVIIKDCRFIGNSVNALDQHIVSVTGRFVKLTNSVFVQGHGPYGKLVMNGQFHENTTASFCTVFQTTSAPPAGMGSPQYVFGIGKAINCAASASWNRATSGDYGVFRTIAAATYCAGAAVNIGGGGAGEIQQASNGDSASVDSTTRADLSPTQNIFEFVDTANYDFNLQAASPLASMGTSNDGIVLDASGNNRPGKDWTAYFAPAESNFGGDLTINLYSNAVGQYQRPGTGGYSIGAYQYPGAYPGDLDKIDQVPFSLAIKGAAGLRGRSIPYCVSRGGDPSTIIETSSV